MTDLLVICFIIIMYYLSVCLFVCQLSFGS